MKKIVLSISVVVVFTVYAIYQKMGISAPLYVSNNENTQSQTIPPVETVVNTPIPTPASKPTPTTSSSITLKPTPVLTPTPTTKPLPVPTPVVPTPTPKPVGMYRDGDYTGNSVNAFYGFIQVKAFISGGKLTDVRFLDYPQDRNNSIRINTEAMPILRSEAVQAQNANVDIVSGATESSMAFVESLGSALAVAKN